MTVGLKSTRTTVNFDEITMTRTTVVYAAQNVMIQKTTKAAKGTAFL